MPKVQVKKIERPALHTKPVAESGIMEKVEVRGNRHGDRLAINLFDVTRMDPVIREIMELASKLDINPILIDADRMDETAVEFTCDLLIAALICDTIRRHDRNKEPYPTRVYLMSKGSTIWRRVHVDDILTVMDGDIAILSPKMFKIEVQKIAPCPPWARKKV